MEPGSESSPPAGGDDAEATAHHFSKCHVWEIGEIKGSTSTVLIEGWPGVELAVVHGPTATSPAETRQGSAIPQLKG